MIKQLKDINEILTALDKLSNLYIILIRQQYYEEQYLCENNIAFDLKKYNL